MEVSDDEILESDVEFGEFDGEDAARAEQSEGNATDDRDEEENEQNPAEMKNYEELLDPVEEPLCENDQAIDELKLQNGEAVGEQQLTVSDEYLDSIKQIDPIPVSMSSQLGKGGGKWKRRKRKNPFINFFLSMYSRRPRQRVVEVARQAGRHWGRMSDSQRKLYASHDLRGFQPQ